MMHLGMVGLGRMGARPLLNAPLRYQVQATEMQTKQGLARVYFICLLHQLSRFILTLDLLAYLECFDRGRFVVV